MNMRTWLRGLTHAQRRRAVRQFRSRHERMTRAERNRQRRTRFVVGYAEMTDATCTSIITDAWSDDGGRAP